MKLNLIVMAIIIFIVGFILNNIVEPYFLRHNFDGFYILQMVSNSTFAVEFYLICIIFYRKKITKQRFLLLLVFYPIYSIFDCNIFRFIGALIGSICIFILYNRKITKQT